ncbi:MAG: alpha/beta hydrolase [Actinobacteria bacterium]|nr:alpha/beta hydrolase [Actinomycetota bacterium]
MNSADCTEVMVDAGTGVRLRTLRWGIPTQSAQVPLVLIHGLASNALLWQGAAHEFMTMGHAVVAIDLRGHGLSEKPDDGYDMQSVTNDVVGVLRALADQGYDRPVVVGQSWGGNIVVELAHTHPELVRGVVAVDGGFLELQTHFPQWEECSIALRPPNLLGTPAARMRGYMQSAHPDWPQSGIDGSMANFEHLADGTIRPWLTLDRHLMILRGLWEHKPTHIYDDISVPVMFVPAEGPGGVFSETKRHAIEHALQRVPKVRVEWFSPADHDLHAQHPVRFAQVVHKATTDGFFS